MSFSSACIEQEGRLCRVALQPLECDGGAYYRFTVEVTKVGFKGVNDELQLNVMAIARFIEALSECYDRLSGKATLVSSESDTFALAVDFDAFKIQTGYVVVSGHIAAFPSENDRVVWDEARFTFAFTTDQTFIRRAITELKVMVREVMSTWDW